MPKKKRQSDEPQLIGFLGVGLDNNDGEHRITRSDHFVLIGGSEKTHESMQNTAIKVTEALERRGKDLPTTPIQEFIEIFREVQK